MKNFWKAKRSLPGTSATSTAVCVLVTPIRIIPEATTVLTAISEDLFGQGEFDLAIAVAQTVVGRETPVDPDAEAHILDGHRAFAV